MARAWGYKETATTARPLDRAGDKDLEQSVRRARHEGAALVSRQREISADQMTAQTLVLPGELPALNEILSAHWRRYAAVKRANTRMVWAEAMAQKLTRINGAVDVVFLHYRPNRRKDPDNVAAGASKCILDGLIKAKILPDDGLKWISSLHHDFEIDKANPRIEVTLTEVTLIE